MYCSTGIVASVPQQAYRSVLLETAGQVASQTKGCFRKEPLHDLVNKSSSYAQKPQNLSIASLSRQVSHSKCIAASTFWQVCRSRCIAAGVSQRVHRSKCIAASSSPHVYRSMCIVAGVPWRGYLSRCIGSGVS